MEKIVSTQFYIYTQNNSGGYFIQNDDVRAILVVEAQNGKEAAQKAEDICENYMEYCSCCGERWRFYEDKIGTESLDELRKKVTTDKWAISFGESAVIYYYDGTKEFIESPSK